MSKILGFTIFIFFMLVAGNLLLAIAGSLFAPYHSSYAAGMSLVSIGQLSGVPIHASLFTKDGAGTSYVTQGYGRTPYSARYPQNWHNGIDIGAPIGTPVLAAEAGTVVATGNQDAYCRKGAYGKFIIIKHENNLVTLYGHLSRQIVQKGDIVSRGQLIGYSGRTGYATGPHLHFTVYAGPTFYMGASRVCGPMPYGGDLNPLGYL